MLGRFSAGGIGATNRQALRAGGKRRTLPRDETIPVPALVKRDGEIEMAREGGAVHTGAEAEGRDTGAVKAGVCV